MPITKVTAAVLNDDAVTNAKIADNSIDSEHYVDGSIDLAHLSANSVDGTKIVDDAVTADKLANSINTEIAANTAKTGITTSQANAITANTAKVTNATHTGDVTGSTALTIAADAVDGTKIADDSIDSEHYVDGSIDAAHLSNDIRGVQYIGIDTGDYIEFTADTQMDFYVNGNNEMRLEADGDLHVDGDVIAASTTVSSDERLKRNIVEYKEAVDTIKEIRGVTFEWKKDGKKSGGVIAQDIEKVLPELVGKKKSLNEQEETLTVDYNGLVGVLIEAVKELSSKVDELEKR